MSTDGGTKAVVAAAGANTAIALMKLGAWVLTGSASMLAESIHSFADTGNQALLLLGGRRASRAADAEHPFGYGRERYLSGFLVSIVLFSVGGLFALYEAYHKWHDVQAGVPDDLLESQWWWVPLAVLGGAVVAESFSLRTAIIESHKTKGSRSWWDFIRQAKAPELPVILLEDLAALAGLIFALFGVGLTIVTHNPIFDVMGTIMIGLLLILVAVVLGIETKSMLIGESAHPDVVVQIEQALDSTPGVDQVIHLRTMHISPEEILVVAKIAVPSAQTAQDIATTINAAEATLRSQVPAASLVYLEPDILLTT